MVGRRGSGCTLHIRMCHHLMSHESASFWYWYCYCYCSGVDANDVCMSILNNRDKLALSKLSNIKEDAALREAFRKDNVTISETFQHEHCSRYISCISRDGYKRLMILLRLGYINIEDLKLC